MQAPSGRSAEKPREAREESPDSLANGRELETMMFSRGVFLKGQTFDSIVIVARPDVSNFSRVIKKLTAHFGPSFV
jgi:hypothetical protein